MKRYGLGFIEALNQLRMGRLPQFAMGGFVPPALPALQPAMATGSRGYSVVNLKLDGQTFSGRFDVDVVGRLRDAIARQALKTGRRR